MDATLWQLELVVPRPALAVFEAALAPISDSLWREPAGEAAWRLAALLPARPDQAALEGALALAAAAAGVTVPAPHLAALPARDWVAEGLRSLERVVAGRFAVRGSHLTRGRARIDIVVDAGQAFGTGHHASTAGCLEMLSSLARGRRFARPLDMGCGSGILAMAMAKLWRVPALGVDIDPLAVATARANAVRNRLGPWLRLVAGDGYRTPAVRARAPFDLVTANILARPLARMAPDLARVLAPGGAAVLAGLLESQEAAVLAAHRAQGLRLRRRRRRDGWSTLLVEKPRAGVVVRLSSDAGAPPDRRWRG